MSATGVKPSPAIPDPGLLEPGRNGREILEPQDLAAAAERQAQVLRVLWNCRRTLFRAGALGLLASTLIAFLIPKSYTSTAQLMPPDSQSATGLAMMAAMASKVGGGLGSMAGDLLGLKSSGALFIGVLRSETAQDRIIEQFHLQKVYGTSLLADARTRLDQNTVISEDRKSGIISISVTDRSPQRAADIANAYIDDLNTLVAELSTSSAHRERVFLEERLKVAKVDLDDAANQLAQFSSKNNTLDIQTEGKAMLDAASTLAGQLVAAQAELEGLRQIYTDNNARVRALTARVSELRKQLERLGGSGENATSRGVVPESAATRSSATAAAADPPSAQPMQVSSGKVDGLPFPTIRNLPLLGAKYADYYRRAKIEETVFELLTEQYELAKVEEAKETPSVKVLDPGRVPEKKSFPPRLLLMFLGTFLATGCAVVWVLGTKSWEEADPKDPRKVLALEVAATVRARLPWSSANGHSSAAPAPPVGGDSTANETAGTANADSIWHRFKRRPPANGGTVE
ncbi:MAG TPA: Wzz/FepE/Etk N-terminal domain-containing protein [Terriglobales bacterium]|nr:Wzz/FepE/Etk N-terminal domain-containing protein [Terriglobales bacterium]